MGKAFESQFKVATTSALIRTGLHEYYKATYKYWGLKCNLRYLHRRINDLEDFEVIKKHIQYYQDGTKEMARIELIQQHKVLKCSYNIEFILTEETFISGKCWSLKQIKVREIED